MAYWVGAANVDATVPGSGAVWVVPAAGGQPQRVGPDFYKYRYPIWSLEATRLSDHGIHLHEGVPDSSAIDWWLVAINGGDAIRTGAYDALARADCQRATPPAIRQPRIRTRPFQGRVVGRRPPTWPHFSADSGDTRNLWETGISPANGRVSGSFTRLTAGAGNEVESSCAAGGPSWHSPTGKSEETSGRYRSTWTVEDQPVRWNGSHKVLPAGTRIAFEQWKICGVRFGPVGSIERLAARTGSRERVACGRLIRLCTGIP